jgi:hypothetical protein
LYSAETVISKDCHQQRLSSAKTVILSLTTLCPVKRI